MKDNPIDNVITYLDFLNGKIEIATHSGFEVDASEISPILKPHQRDAVMWAIRGGRRALFESFGLGKTIQQLEICRIITGKEGGKMGRRGMACELNPEYYRDGLHYLREAECDRTAPTLFDALSA